MTKNGDHSNRQYVNREVRQAADNAGVQRMDATAANGFDRTEVTGHVLRHTFAKHALRNELDTY
jgi:integrase/recombinase XerD